MKKIPLTCKDRWHQWPHPEVESCPTCNQRSVVGRNLEAPVKKVEHKTLQRVGDSPYKSHCPVCSEGVLVVRRNRETFELVALDRCLLCGQAFVYTDINEMRERYG